MSHLGSTALVGGRIAIPGGSFTRPADTIAYAIGDLIANDTTAGSVVPITIAVCRSELFTAMVRRLRLKVNDSAWLAATIRVHLFKDSPTVTVGDNGVFNSSNVLAATESNYIGYSDITLSQQFASSIVKGIGVPAVGSEWNVVPSSATPNIFALLEARTAVTPASGKTFTLVAEAHQN